MDLRRPYMYSNDGRVCRSLGHVKPGTFTNHIHRGSTDESYDYSSAPLDLSFPKSKSLQHVENQPLTGFSERRVSTDRRSLPDPCAVSGKSDCLTDRMGCARNCKLSVYSQPGTPTVHQLPAYRPNTSQDFIYGSHPDDIYLRSETITYDIEDYEEEIDYSEATSGRHSKPMKNSGRNLLTSPTIVYKYKKLCYILIIAAVVTFGIILAGGISAFLIWLALNSGGVLILETFLQASKLTVESAQIMVTSLNQFNNIVIAGSAYTTYFMTIALDSVDDWPANVPVKGANQISELHIIGHFDQVALVNLLQTTANLTKLKLQNDGNSSMCSIDKKAKATHHKNIGIESLAIGNFSRNCFLFYKTINTYLTFHNLKEFVLSDSIIDSNNALYIQSMLRDSRHTLKKVEFSNTELDTSTFNWENIGIMPEVTQVVFDVWTAATHNLSNLMFSYAFPNLVEFSFGHQERSQNDLNLLFGLTQLKQLEVSISLPVEALNFSLAFLQEEFPSLENATIFLTFATCHDAFNTTQNGKNYLLDLDKIKEPLLSNMYIDSNCRLFDGYEEYMPL